MTGMKRILPHICLDLAVVLLTLWVIDTFFNPNVQGGFLTGNVFKIFFVIFLILVIVESVTLIAYQRRK